MRRGQSALLAGAGLFTAVLFLSALPEHAPQDWVTRHGLSAAQYQEAFNDFTGQGYRLKVVSGYQVGPEDRYAALWEKTSGPLFAARHGIKGAFYQGIFDNFYYQGYRLAYVNAFASGSAENFNGVWQKLELPTMDANHTVSTCPRFLMLSIMNASAYNYTRQISAKRSLLRWAG